MCLNVSTITNEYHFLTYEFAFRLFLVSDNATHTHHQNCCLRLNVACFHNHCTTCSKCTSVYGVIYNATRQILYKSMVATYISLVFRCWRSKGYAYCSIAIRRLFEIMTQNWRQIKQLETIAQWTILLDINFCIL